MCELGLAWLHQSAGSPSTLAAQIDDISVACEGSPLVYLPRGTPVLVVEMITADKVNVMIPDGRIGWVYIQELIQFPPF